MWLGYILSFFFLYYSQDELFLFMVLIVIKVDYVVGTLSAQLLQFCVDSFETFEPSNYSDVIP